MRALIEAFDPTIPIERAWTPPSAWYTDPGIAALERRAVFGRSWQPVARRTELAEPGAYVSGCLLGEPYLVVRGEDGVLRAFRNLCRHKGREVVTGAGRVEALVCGYHAWRYDLRGRLRSAPRMAGVRDFDRERMALAPLRVEEWGPWVWLTWSEAGPSLSSRLAGLGERLDATGWSALRYVGRTSWILQCNWKVVIDNYLDGGYHIPHMHPTLDAQVDMATYRTEVFDTWSLQSVASNPRPDGRIAYEAGRRIGERALYAWIHPNITLNRYGPMLDANLVIPLGPDRCEVRYDFFAEGGLDEAFVAESRAQSDLTQREDTSICESVQRGLGSTGYDRGRYAPEVEIGEHHFHRLLHADLLAGLDGPVGGAAGGGARRGA